MLNDLQGAGYSDADLKAARYTAQELKEAGTSLVQLKAAGVTMFAVGFGLVRRQTLEAVASSPASQYAVHAGSLQQVRDHFRTHHLCTTIASPSAPPPPPAPRRLVAVGPVASPHTPYLAEARGSKLATRRSPGGQSSVHVPSPASAHQRAPRDG